MNETEKRNMGENERNVQKARREGDADKLKELLDNMPEHKNYKHLKDVAKKAIANLNAKQNELSKPLETATEEKNVSETGGSVDTLNKITAPVDTKIGKVGEESNLVVAEAEQSIAKISINSEALMAELTEKEKRLTEVNTELAENEAEMKKMESYIKIAEGFLDLGLPKETIIKLLTDSGAPQDKITAIMSALEQNVDTSQNAASEGQENKDTSTEEVDMSWMDEAIKDKSTEIQTENNPISTTENKNPITPTPETNVITPDTSPAQEPFIPTQTREPLIPTQEPVIPTQNVVLENKDMNETRVFMMPANRGFWEKMSEGGRSLMSKLYKGINAVPVVKRLVAKVEIAYNQFWIDAKEGRGVNLKDKMDGLDLEMKTLNQSKTRIAEIMENLKRSGNPGYAPMALDIKKIEQNISKIANKKDKIQSKLEGKENKIKTYTNKRDAIANKMIGNYERKLSPIEGKLDAINKQRDEMNLLIIGKEIELDAEINYFNEVEKTKNDLFQTQIDLGKSTEKAGRNKTVKMLEKQIAIGRKKIEDKKAELEKEQIKINKKIARIDEEAQPYRDRRDQFIRIKDNRPIDFNIQTRTQLPNETILEETKINTRINPENNVSDNNAPASIDTSNTSSPEQIPNMGTRISKYNESLRQKNIKTELQIDPSYLTQKIGLRNETTVSLVMFKKAIEQYYKIKKVPESDYKTLLNNLK